MIFVITVSEHGMTQRTVEVATIIAAGLARRDVTVCCTTDPQRAAMLTRTGVLPAEPDDLVIVADEFLTRHDLVGRWICDARLILTAESAVAADAARHRACRVGAEQVLTLPDGLDALVGVLHRYLTG